MAGRILAIGSHSLGMAFDELVLDLANGPRILFVPNGARVYRGADGEEPLRARIVRTTPPAVPR